MLCLACSRLSSRGVSRSGVCSRCRSELVPGPDRLLTDGPRVRSAFLHRGPARALVHAFKYKGIEEAGDVLAAAMAPLLPDEGTLVPLPRSGWRLLVYGIDPAESLARKLSQLTGRPVASSIRPPLMSRSQAGRSRSGRRAPMFKLEDLPPGSLVLIDDVVTTGGTIRSAYARIGPMDGAVVEMALTATASPW